MDELLSPILRFLGYVVSELLLGTFFYAIGWPFVKAVTLGKYPKHEWLSGSKNEAYVCCVGIFVFSISLMAALGQLSAMRSTFAHFVRWTAKSCAFGRPLA